MASLATKETAVKRPGKDNGKNKNNNTSRERTIHAEQALAVRHTKLSNETAEQIAGLFAVLSDPTRLQVLYALLRSPDGELCVGDLATGLGRDDTTISHQLRVLRNQHIVAIRKVGRVVYYRLVDDHIRQLLTLGMAHAEETPSHLSTIKKLEVPA